MKTLDYIHLDAVAAGKVVEALQQLLADYQVFYTNLRGFHWNIKGHGFFVLHSKFEDMYNDAAEKVDELAERILMLGGVPVNKFSEYLKVAKVKEVHPAQACDWHRRELPFRRRDSPRPTGLSISEILSRWQSPRGSGG